MEKVELYGLFGNYPLKMWSYVVFSGSYSKKMEIRGYSGKMLKKMEL